MRVAVFFSARRSIVRMGAALPMLVKRRLLSVTLLPVAASLLSCATLVTASGADRNLITSSEIEVAKAETAYDLVAKLRANFLHPRGPNSILLKVTQDPTVYLDDVEYGPIASLHTIQASTIAEIRFFEGWEATTKYGTGHVAGVIQIYTRYQ